MSAPCTLFPGGPAVVAITSSTLCRETDLALAVHQIYRQVRAGRRVVAVVSAYAGATARGGEVAPAEMLVRALDRAGIPATLGNLGGNFGNLGNLDGATLLARLERHGVVVVPGAGVAGAAGLVGRRRESAAPTPAPLRVVLLGLGTVGGGVYRHLLAQPERFVVVGAAVRGPERHLRAGVPAAVLERDPWRLLERPCDVVVEALGGLDPAVELIAAALAGGRDVVSANKKAMAEAGERLARLAAAHGAELRCGAAVGGAVPVLEAVARAAAAGEVQAVCGVLNGTCNFVLDRVAAGLDLAAAVRLAQDKGFAEADPARDLDGRDAACKLRIVARAAFGVELPAGAVMRRGLEAIDAGAVAAARARGRVIRLVAECRREGSGAVRAAVRPVALPARHFLAGARNEENRVVVERTGGPPLRLAGRGAGRWPTAEAVFADILDLADRSASRGRRIFGSLGHAGQNLDRRQDLQHRQPVAAPAGASRGGREVAS